jgi:hypothetical protein
MQSTGLMLKAAAVELGLELHGWNGNIDNICAKNVCAQRHAEIMLEKAKQQIQDRADDIAAGHWVKVESGWMVAVSGNAQEGHLVRITKKSGEQQLKRLIDSEPTEYGILWHVA